MKKVKQRIISCLLAVVMIFSSVSFDVLSTPVSAADVGGITNKLFSVGFKFFAKALNKGLTGSESESAKKAAGLINSILLGGAGTTANKLAEITALCKQILAEVQKIEAQMNESFSLVEQMLGEQNAAAARKTQDDKWNEDIVNVIDKYNVSQALDQYLVYMDAAANYAENQSDAALKAEFERQKDILLQKFALMYSDKIPLDIISDSEKLQEYIFSDNLIDNAFINMIDELSSKLVKTNSSTVTLAETAAQTAEAYLPFSHQQYQFVYTIIDEQLMEINNCILLAAEYYDLQGDYILKKNGEDSDVHKGYLKLLDQLDTVIYGTGKNSAVSRIDTMLSAKMVISTNVQKSLDDYMRPEDAVSVNMQIQDYKESERIVSYDDYGKEVFYYDTVKKKYIDEYLKFNRVMVGDTIYYIIDPEQFEKTPLALSTSALEFKHNNSSAGDWHLTSMDFLNLVKAYSDGTNEFEVPYDTSAYDRLVSTNSFFVVGGVPKTYLQGYVPEPTDKNKTLYLLTSRYENTDFTFVWDTTYANYWMVEASKSFGTGSLTATKVKGDVLQPDHSGNDKRFSVILSQKSEVYQQPLTLSVPDAGVESASLTITPDTGDAIVINSGESKTVTSGEKLSVTVKMKDGTDGFTIKCIRDLDAFGSGEESEYEILGADDFDAVTPNADGSYTVDYIVPYTSAKIVVETQHDTVYDNGICTICGEYQSAEQNSDGCYEIGNAGQLLWFAEMVNGTAEHSVYDKQSSSAKAVLTADVDLENRVWNPINNFSGVFDGKNHTISGLWVPSTFPGYQGLFGSASGEIRNFTLEGKISASSFVSYIGGVVGHLNGGKVSRVISEVEISNGYNSKSIGGVVGYCAGEITNCAYVGKTNVSIATDVGGIAGTIDSSFSIVRKCFFYGSMTASATTGNVLRPYVYDHYGAIAGRVKSYSKIEDNYYIDNETRAFYIAKLSDSAAASVNYDTFRSGKLASTLNNGVTDGTQAWYQNIDNGSTLDRYPKISGGTVYRSADGGYTNITAGHGVTFSGIKLEDTYIKIELCSEDDDEYGLFSSELGSNIINAYRITVMDKDGNIIPSEKWNWKNIKISVPIANENVRLAMLDGNGKIVYCSADSFENGAGIFVIPSLSRIFVLCNRNKGEEKPDVDKEKPNTGDENPATGSSGTDIALAISIAAVSLAAIVVFGRERKHIG